MRASETAEMIFNDCRVHKSQMLGNLGEGFIQAMKVLEGGRISIASLSLGIAIGAYEAALQYSKERHQFNQPISKFQGIAFKLADMATKIEAAKLLTFRAGDLKNKGQEVKKESAMAKLVCLRSCRGSRDGRGSDFRWLWIYERLSSGKIFPRC